MKVYIGENTSLSEDILNKLRSVTEVCTVEELWNLLNEIEEPCCVFPVEKDGENVLVFLHPYDW